MNEKVINRKGRRLMKKRMRIEMIENEKKKEEMVDFERDNEKEL